MPITVEIAPDGPVRAGTATVVKITNSDSIDISRTLSISVGTTQEEASARAFRQRSGGDHLVEHTIFVKAGYAKVVDVHDWGDATDEGKILVALFEETTDTRIIS